MRLRFNAALAAFVAGAAVLGGVALAQDGAVRVPAAQTVPASPVLKVPKKSIFRNLYPAGRIETGASLQYNEMTRQAFQRRKLAEDNDPQVRRLRRIAADLLPHAPMFNERAKDWKWEVNLFYSEAVNAFCMPGGKIAFFSGILDKLKLTDDEVAIIMGHEIGHALWEHARERTVKTNITSIGSRVIGALLFGQAGEIIGAAGSSLAALKFSRNDETEADLIGLELAARAGYDPRAGVTLWTKMAEAAKGAPPQWMSSHPSDKTRIKTIEDNLKAVQPLFEAARGKRG